MPVSPKYFNLNLSGSHVQLVPQSEKPLKQGSALATLLKIEGAFKKGKVAENQELRSSLFQKASLLRNGFNRKANRIFWIFRKLFGVDKKQKEIEQVFSRIKSITRPYTDVVICDDGFKIVEGAKPQPQNSALTTLKKIEQVLNQNLNYIGSDATVSEEDPKARLYQIATQIHDGYNQKANSLSWIRRKLGNVEADQSRIHAIWTRICKPPLSVLPKEILLHITSFMRASDLKNFALASRDHAEFVCDEKIERAKRYGFNAKPYMDLLDDIIQYYLPEDKNKQSPATLALCTACIKGIKMLLADPSFKELPTLAKLFGYNGNNMEEARSYINAIVQDPENFGDFEKLIRIILEETFIQKINEEFIEKELLFPSRPAFGKRFAALDEDEKFNEEQRVLSSRRVIPRSFFDAFLPPPNPNAVRSSRLFQPHPFTPSEPFPDYIVQLLLNRTKNKGDITNRLADKYLSSLFKKVAISAKTRLITPVYADKNQLHLDVEATLNNLANLSFAQIAELLSLKALYHPSQKATLSCLFKLLGNDNLLKKIGSSIALHNKAYQLLCDSIKNGYENTAFMLIANSVPVYIEGAIGDTPLHLALQKGNITMAKELILHGATLFNRERILKQLQSLIQEVSSNTQTDLVRFDATSGIDKSHAQPFIDEKTLISRLEAIIHSLPKSATTLSKELRSLIEQIPDAVHSQHMLWQAQSLMKEMGPSTPTDLLRFDIRSNAQPIIDKEASKDRLKSIIKCLPANAKFLSQELSRLIEQIDNIFQTSTESNGSSAHPIDLTLMKNLKEIIDRRPKNEKIPPELKAFFNQIVEIESTQKVLIQLQSLIKVELSQNTQCIIDKEALSSKFEAIVNRMPMGAIPFSQELQALLRQFFDIRPELTRRLQAIVSGANFKEIAPWIQYDVPLDMVDTNGMTPLFQAIGLGILDLVELLLKKGANPNLTNTQGETPLYLAVKSHRKDFVMLLLKYDASPNTLCHGKSPLILATEYADWDIAYCLLEGGAFPDTTDRFGETPLFYAVRSKQQNLVRLLLKKGANPNITDSMTATPLTEAVASDSLACVTLLLEGGADPNTTCHGSSSLMLAMHTFRWDIARCLLEGGASPNTTIYSGETPLFYAITRKKQDLVVLLLKKGANPNALYNGVPLLLLAVREDANSDSTLSTLLLDHGALVDAIDPNGETPLFQAVRLGNRQQIEVLLKHDANRNWVNAKGVSLLMLAADYGDHELFNLLLNSESKLDLKDQNDFTILHYWANAKRLHLSILTQLIEKKVNVNCQDKNGMTPLNILLKKWPPHLSSKNHWDSFIKMVGLLLDNDADPNILDSEGKAPIFYAHKDSTGKLLEMLLARGAKSEQRDKAQDYSYMLQQFQTWALNLMGGASSTSFQ